MVSPALRTHPTCDPSSQRWKRINFPQITHSSSPTADSPSCPQPCTQLLKNGVVCEHGELKEVRKALTCSVSQVKSPELYKPEFKCTNSWHGLGSCCSSHKSARYLYTVKSLLVGLGFSTLQHSALPGSVRKVLWLKPRSTSSPFLSAGIWQWLS